MIPERIEAADPAQVSAGNDHHLMKNIPVKKPVTCLLCRRQRHKETGLKENANEIADR